MKTISLAKSAPGSHVEIEVTGESTFALGFDPATASLSREGDDLLIRFDDGGDIQLKNFYTEFRGDGSFLFETGDTTSTCSEFFAAQGAGDLMPEGEELPLSAGGSPFSALTFAKPALLHGISPLGGEDHAFLSMPEGISLLDGIPYLGRLDLSFLPIYDDTEILGGIARLGGEDWPFMVEDLEYLSPFLFMESTLPSGSSVLEDFEFFLSFEFPEGNEEPYIPDEEEGEDDSYMSVKGSSITVDERYLADGTLGLNTARTSGTGSFTVNLGGEDGEIVLSYGDDSITLSVTEGGTFDLSSLESTSLTVNGVEIVLTGVSESSSGVWTISYSYELTEAQTHSDTSASGSSDTLVASVGITATSASGNTGSAAISVTVYDDAPEVEDETATLNVNSDVMSITGNVLENDDSGADTPDRVVSYTLKVVIPEDSEFTLVTVLDSYQEEMELETTTDEDGNTVVSTVLTLVPGYYGYTVKLECPNPDNPEDTTYLSEYIYITEDGDYVIWPVDLRLNTTLQEQGIEDHVYDYGVVPDLLLEYTIEDADGDAATGTLTVELYSDPSVRTSTSTSARQTTLVDDESLSTDSLVDDADGSETAVTDAKEDTEDSDTDSSDDEATVSARQVSLLPDADEDEEDDTLFTDIDGADAESADDGVEDTADASGLDAVSGLLDLDADADAADVASAIDGLDGEELEGFLSEFESIEAEGTYDTGEGSLVLGSSGSDYVEGGSGADYLLAGAGNDLVVHDAGNVLESGGSGIDFLLSQDGNLTLDDLLAEDGEDEEGPVVEGIEVLLTGEKALDLTSIARLADEYGITLGTDEDGNETMSLDTALWSYDDASDAWNFVDGGLSLQTTLEEATASSESENAGETQQVVFVLENGNG